MYSFGFKFFIFEIKSRKPQNEFLREFYGFLQKTYLSNCNSIICQRQNLCQVDIRYLSDNEKLYVSAFFIRQIFGLFKPKNAYTISDRVIFCFKLKIWNFKLSTKQGFL